MTDQKHTEGKWGILAPELNKNAVAATDHDGSIYTVVSLSPGHYDIGGRRATDEELEANARLIANAPETATELARVKAVNEELIGANTGLASSLKRIMGYVEDGTLVRDISKDGASDFALKMMHFVTTLQTANSAIAAAEKESNANKN